MFATRYMASQLACRGAAFPDLSASYLLLLYIYNKRDISQSNLVFIVAWNLVPGGYIDRRFFSAHMMGVACGMYEG